MNPVYTIMTPTKIPVGKIDNSINNQFIKDCKEYLEDLEKVNQSGLINPIFMSKMDLHLIKIFKIRI